ncbi:MAG: AI-2E family transporter, partial [Pseudomonadota bacterium]
MTKTAKNLKIPPLLFWTSGIFLFFIFISLIKSILLPFVVGILSAYFLNPLVGQLLKFKLSRSVSAGLITASFFVIAITFITLISPTISEQLSNFIGILPDYAKEFETRYTHDIKHYMSKLSPDRANAIKDAAGNLGTTAVSWVADMLSDILASGFALLNILSLLLITPVVVFYLLRDWEKLLAEFDKLLPRKHYEIIKAQLHIVDLTISGFIRGQTNVCLIMATYYAVILSILGLNFALIIGILTGFLLFIPFVGFIACFMTS